MIHHISISVSGLLRLSNLALQRQWGGAIKVGGRRLRTASEIRGFLLEKQAEGYEVLPTEGCDNFDKMSGCMGHDDTPQEQKGADNAKV